MDHFRLEAFADKVDTSIDKQIVTMKEENSSLLEIGGVNGQNIADISNDKAREFRKRMDYAGLGISAMVWNLQKFWENPIFVYSVSFYIKKKG